MKEKEKKRIKYIGMIAAAVVLAVYGGASVFRHVPWQADYFHAIVMVCLLAGIAMIALTEYLLLYKKREIWQIYPVVGFFLSAMIFLALPTYAKPDEITHFDTAYELSNRWLGLAVGEGDFRFVIMRRQCDMDYSGMELSVEQYNWFGDCYVTPEQRTELVYAPNNTSNGEKAAYYAAAFGILIGRWLHLGFSGTAALGTLFQAVFFLLALTYALYKLPFGRRILFVVALLPMTLQQSVSFSYDNALIAASAVVISLSLRWAYGEPPAKTVRLLRATPGEAGAFLLAALLLLLTKSGVCAPLLLLPLFLRLTKGTAANKKRRYIFLAGAAVVILLLLFVAAGGWARIQSVSARPYIAWDDSYGFTVAEYLANPGYVLQILLRTLAEKTPYYVLGLVGGLLGWIDITISKKVIVLLLFVLLLALVRTPSERTLLVGKHRAALLAIALLIDLLSMLAMLLYWTPMFSETIEGVQGRYFLPTFPAVLIALGLWKKPVWKNNMDGFFVSAMPLLDFAVVICIFINIVTK